MPKSAAPVDMLHKCRGHFAKEAEDFAKAARAANTVWDRNAAEALGATARRFVSEIDQTLRDWA